MARNDGTGVTRLVAQHAAALAFDALPRELVDLVKQIVLDTIGVVIGASGLAPEARIVAE
jgi:2-methylcitrate dehydratase PrpD